MIDHKKLYENVLLKNLNENNNQISNEIEFKFGTFDNIFKTGVSKKIFNNIKKIYEDNYFISKEEYYLNINLGVNNKIRTKINSKKNIIEYANNNDFITNSMDYSIISKSNNGNDNSLNIYGLKLSKSIEKNIKTTDMTNYFNKEIKNSKIPNTYRLINRISYEIIPGLKLELSKTKQSKGLTFIESKVKDVGTNYEVELEIYDYEKYKKTIDINIIIENLYKINLIIHGGFFISPLNEIQNILNIFKLKYKKNILAQNIPLTKNEIDIIKKGNYVINDKADGFRYMLYIDDNNQYYLINSNYDLYFTGINNSDINIDIELNNSLFDGELIFIKSKNTYEYHIFDILFLNNTDLRNLPFYNKEEVSIYKNINNYIICNTAYIKQYNFYNKNGDLIDEYNNSNTKKIFITDKKEVNIEPKTRYGIILNIFKKLNNNIIKNNNDLLFIKYKSFYPYSYFIKISYEFNIINIHTLIQKISLNDDLYELDGLIIQNADGKYPTPIDNITNPQWNDSFKWKFKNNITIDFKLYNFDVDKLNNTVEISLTDISNKIYAKQKFDLFNNELYTLNKEFIDFNDKNLIVECNYDNEKWNLIKIRYDKTKPNAPKTIMTTMNLINNPVNFEELFS